MNTPNDPNPSLKRGIHPLHLLALIAIAALAFPVTAYVFLLLIFALLRGTD